LVIFADFTEIRARDGADFLLAEKREFARKNRKIGTNSEKFSRENAKMEA
jgi:hypothetical protein